MHTLTHTHLYIHTHTYIHTFILHTYKINDTYTFWALKQISDRLTMEGHPPATPRPRKPPPPRMSRGRVEELYGDYLNLWDEITYFWHSTPPLSRWHKGRLVTFIVISICKDTSYNVTSPISDWKLKLKFLSSYAIFPGEKSTDALGRTCRFFATPLRYILHFLKVGLTMIVCEINKLDLRYCLRCWRGSIHDSSWQLVAQSSRSRFGLLYDRLQHGSVFSDAEPVWWSEYSREISCGQPVVMMACISRSSMSYCLEARWHSIVFFSFQLFFFASAFHNIINIIIIILAFYRARQRLWPLSVKDKEVTNAVIAAFVLIPGIWRSTWSACLLTKPQT